MKQNVAIIGGGLAGLTAATYLARTGYDVTVFEQSTGYGGRARTQESDGFYFNQGAHALYLGAKGVQVLKELEIPYSGKKTNVTVQAIKNKKNYLFPLNEKTINESPLLSESSKKSLARFFAMLSTVDTTKIQDITLSEWLKENVVDADAISFIQAMVQLNTFVSDPQIQSAGTALDQLQIGNSGVVYLDKGWQTLADGLALKAKSYGAKIISNKKVVSVEFDDMIRSITLSDGTKVEASIVILATPPSVASSLLGKRIPELEKFVTSAIPLRTASLDVALSSLPNPDNHFALRIDSPLYLSVHLFFAKLAPKGGALIHLSKYLSHSNHENPKNIRAELEEILDMMQSGWRNYLIKERFLPSMTTSNAILTASQNGFDGRPSPKINGVKNLYVVGDWVAHEGWLADASFASARQAAELIVNKIAMMQRYVV
ncbi:MAG: NAD(P)/FAD-dependent oxidoreductase [Thaumarchaeota archaeon]|nr:NAD(P)/FAD-dependent oxidoreductase [Nitrososphaerota archaeon]